MLVAVVGIVAVAAPVVVATVAVAAVVAVAVVVLMVEAMVPGSLAPWPKLQALVKRVGENEKIAAYKASE